MKEIAVVQIAVVYCVFRPCRLFRLCRLFRSCCLFRSCRMLRSCCRFRSSRMFRSCHVFWHSNLLQERAPSVGPAVPETCAAKTAPRRLGQSPRYLRTIASKWDQVRVCVSTKTNALCPDQHIRKQIEPRKLIIIYEWRATLLLFTCQANSDLFAL